MDSPFQLEDQQILEEDYDESYEPTEDEVLEYCKVLGLDPVTERDLLYIAKEGIKAPLPTNWKPVEDQTGNVYYFNFGTGDSTWEHPCDEFYRKLLEQERDKRANEQPTEQTDAMLSKGKKKGVTLKGKGGRQTGPPMQNGGQQQRIGLRKLPNTPAQGKLAPLSMGKPLPSIGGLPPLKPHSTLAPLRPPPSLGGSLNSTGGSSTGGSSRGTERLGVSRGEGFDLLGSVRISTQFEEEDTETESSSRGGGFKTKLHLLGAEDLGLKISDDDLDSTEDVSKELRQIMDISSDQDNSEPSARPPLRPTAPPPPKGLKKSPPVSLNRRGGVGGSPPPSLRRGGGVGGSPPSSLNRRGGVGGSPPSSLNRRGGVGGSPPSSLHRSSGVGESPVSSPRLLRPGAARAKSGSTKSGSNSPVNSGASSPSQPPRTKTLHAAGKLGPGTAQQDVLSREHDIALRQLREQHELELKQTLAELSHTLEERQASMLQENELKLTSFREQLAREQLSEEKRLRCESGAALAEVRVRVSEEREDKEARLEEEKVDYLRKMRLQLSNEREREEKLIKEDSNKTLNDLREQHKKELNKTEAEIRSRAEAEIEALRERLNREIAVERETVHESLEGELEGVRSGKDVQLTVRKEEIEAKHQKQLEQLEQLREKHEQVSTLTLEQLREKHEQEFQNALADIEASNKLDQAKNESLQTHQQSLEELQTELSAELESQREDLKSKHKQEMEKLASQYARELTQTKQEWAEKISSERQRLSAEFETVKTSLHQEHEVIVQSSKSKLQTAQAELKARAQQQSEELASLQSEHAAKVSELTSLREQLSLEETTLTQQRAELERLRTKLASDRGDLDREQAELETYREELASERGEVDRELSQKHTRLGRDGQATVQREEESLDQLQRSHKNLKEDIVKLEQQKETVQSSLKQLLRTREKVRVQVSTLKSEETPAINGGSDGESGGLMDVRELDPTTQNGGDTSTQTDVHSDAGKRSKVAGPRDSKHRAHTRHNRPHITKGYDDGNLSLLQEIRDKLDQEAIVLSQLEEKMLGSGSHQGRVDGTPALDRELEDVSDEDNLPTDIPSPKTYLSKLQASLDKSRSYTRSRHQSSPLPTHTLINTSSDSEDDDDDTTPQSSISANEHLQSRGAKKFSSSTRRILSDDGGGTVRKTARMNAVDSDKTQQHMIFHSLSMINSQLGQLLVRLPGTLHAPHTPTQSHGYEASGASNNRWAEPTLRARQQVELDLADKRRSYLGASATASTGSTVLSNSHLRSSGPLPPSTEQLINNQTDWLKEFRQSIPINHHRPSTGPNLLPRKRKLVLDHGNNVKLMHI